MITVKDIDKLATLSRMDISPGEKEKLLKDLNAILEYVGQISQSGAGREKSIGSSDFSMIHNVMREDVPSHEPGIFTQKILAQAPDTENGYIKVKKVL